MSYVPQSGDERQQLLKSIGVEEFEELLEGIPKELRVSGKLKIGEPLSELETVNHLTGLAAKNISAENAINFIGGGAYDHFIPAVVPYLVSRPEFMTAYTPYQAEVSQGTLQAIYEFQTLISRLTGMEVANASMYDGASAAAEAALLAIHQLRRNKIVLAPLLHPHFKDAVRVYLRGTDVEIVDLSHSDGITDLVPLKESIADAACFIFANPNFYGIIEPAEEIATVVKQAGALLVAVVNPISLAYLKTPGEYDADICVGEGQSLGNSLNFGGPYLGFFAAKKKYIRKLPGRITAMTHDKQNRRAFCLTLQTREQHIRRDKATSNICTNQALCALAGTIYLATMGKQGLKEVARLCFNKAHYLQKILCELAGVSLAFDRPFFMEFTLKLPQPAKQILDQLVKKNILAGVATSRFLWEDDYLISCATEKRSRDEIECFRNCLKEVIE